MLWSLKICSKNIPNMRVLPRVPKLWKTPNKCFSILRTKKHKMIYEDDLRHSKIIQPGFTFVASVSYKKCTLISTHKWRRYYRKALYKGRNGWRIHKLNDVIESVFQNRLKSSSTFPVLPLSKKDFQGVYIICLCQAKSLWPRANGRHYRKSNNNKTHFRRTEKSVRNFKMIETNRRDDCTDMIKHCLQRILEGEVAKARQHITKSTRKEASSKCAILKYECGLTAYKSCWGKFTSVKQFWKRIQVRHKRRVDVFNRMQGHLEIEMDISLKPVTPFRVMYALSIG